MVFQLLEKHGHTLRYFDTSSFGKYGHIPHLERVQEKAPYIESLTTDHNIVYFTHDGRTLKRVRYQLIIIEEAS